MFSRKSMSLIAVLGLLIFSVYAAAGPNANAVLSLDLIADGGAGNEADDGVTSGTVSGRGTTIAIEIFATGVRTSLIGVTLEFDFDASLLSFVEAENNAFSLTLPEGSTGTHLATRNPVTLASSGFLARAEFTTVSDVTGREFSIGIESVTLAESTTSSDKLITTSVITFNATPSPDFDGDDFVGFSDFLIFAQVFGSERGDGTYDARIDLNSDGSIGFTDFLIFAQSFGSAPPSTGGGSPDLVVQSPSVSNNNVASGATFTLGATVRNQGDGSSAATTLHYYRSTDATVSTSDTEVGTDAVSSLSAGDTSAESINLTAPSSSGTFYYGACVDAVADESDTGNNCSAAVSITVAAVIPTDDRAALVALYEATDGPSWTNKENWLSTAPLDEWYGVTTDSNGRVTVLNLRDNNLQGTLPVQLARLTNLRWLNLYVNQLTGTIPTELGRLINLTSLYLGFNKLSAAIPTELGRLTNLEKLGLDNNHLTGPIPTELGRLSKLTWLELQENQLTGTIPTQLGQLTNFTYLELGGNTLTGPIPVELGQLSKLTRLYLYRNQLTGPIPVELGRLSKLTSLDLGTNQLTGAIPVELGQLTNLTFLWLNGNQLTGPIPTELGQLTKLTQLYLYKNQLTGTIPTQLGQLTKLTHLWLNINKLSGTIPTQLGRLINLTSLYLGFNKLSGAIPTELGRLTKLTSLALGYNKMTGPIPTELGRLSKLTWLELQENQLTGTIPTQLGQLTNLTWLELGGNTLTGPIPVELGQLTKLTSLALGYNKMTGPIPTELGQLTKLTNLRLSINKLSGAIPKELGQLTKLTHLWLNINKLSGTIPPELARLTSLTELVLENNAGLSGPLPPAFTDLTPELVRLGGTGVCLPLTEEFVEWKESIPTGSGGAYCADPEREALIALYKQTNGPNWKNKKNWSALAPLGEWYGVTTDADGRVTQLNLEDNDLSGLLPPTLSSLANLKTLNLAANPGLSGPLPQVFTRLPLESLDLEGTRLCAPPRAEFQTWLDGIRDGDVSRCTDVRPDFYALVALYSGTDGPNWTNATNWTSAKTLDQWYGVTTDGSGRVTGLSLNENDLQGTIPVELGQLTNLDSLNLSGNQLTGNVPQELGQLTNLKGLNLSGNEISGNVPSELGQLTNLESLLLARNKLTDEIPVELGRLTNLRKMDLQLNLLTGNIPAELGRLTNLRILDLSDNPLDGEIPSELGQLTNLESLTLWFNSLTGEIPPELGRLTNLRTLYLVDNFFTGNIPPKLGQLTNLEELWIINNTLTGEIPQELGQLTNLKGLNLQFNQLTGSIPTELGQLTNLQRLSLSTNQLTGNIPPELGQLTNLTTLNLRKNQLSGNIPPDLGQITDLQELYLSTNQLTGNIPPEMGRLTYLRKLNLSANQLTGNIPPELGQLTNLTTLNLAFNGALSGTLPAALTGLTLETLILQETLLCTPQDAGFQHWLRAISYTRVPNCARSDEAAAYLVQATQSLEYPVPLVAGEPALLRVFVTADREVDASMPPVQATFYRDGVEVHTAEIGGQAASIPWQVNEASLLNSANAMVPGSVVMPGLEMVVDIDPGQTLDQALGVSARLPPTGRTPLNVRSVPPFDLTLVPFLWEENPDRSVLTQTESLSSESDLFRLTRDILPVREFRLKVHEPVMTSVDPTSDGVEQMGPETEVIYAMEGAKGHYMAIFRSVGESGLKGIAFLPGFVSLSILDENTIAHELGHNLNLAHAPGCGAGGPDPEYPYEDGAIGAWGYDFVNESLVSPATSDLMTYCDPQWISDYSFSRALAHRYQGESAPLAAAKTSPTKGLLVWGGLTENKIAFLEPAFVVSAPPSLPRIDGPYRLTGEDDDGNNLFSLPFGMPEYGCGSKGGAFAFILPVREDWAGRLARIALSGPEGVSILDGEDDPSATLLLDRATGHVRGILRDWPEAAAKRPAASLGLTETGLEVLTSHGIPDAASWER